MKSWFLVSAFCTLSAGLSYQPGAFAYSVDASSTYFYRTGPNGFTAQVTGAATDANNIVPGASGVGSSLLRTFPSTRGLSFSVVAQAVQDYSSFHGYASAQLTRDDTSGSFEILQVFAEGRFIESLTIDAPPGMAGQPGSLMLGWDITGSASNGASGDTRLSINARTTASLPNASSQIGATHGNGLVFLMSPISFTFGSAFDLIIDSAVFAAVSYDNTSNRGPLTFSDSASADFLHTAVLSRVGVFDSAGNALTNFSLSTGSGRAFPAATPISEPASFAMVLAGLGLLTALARSRKRPLVLA